MAAQYGLTDLTRMLLVTGDSQNQDGANPDIGDQINQRPIHYAI